MVMATSCATLIKWGKEGSTGSWVMHNIELSRWEWFKIVLTGLASSTALTALYVSLAVAMAGVL